MSTTSHLAHVEDHMKSFHNTQGEFLIYIATHYTVICLEQEYCVPLMQNLMNSGSIIAYSSSSLLSTNASSASVKWDFLRTTHPCCCRSKLPILFISLSACLAISRNASAQAFALKEKAKNSAESSLFSSAESLSVAAEQVFEQPSVSLSDG